MAKFEKRFRLYDTTSLARENSFTGIKQISFQMISGSRLIFCLSVVSIDPATSIEARIKNGFTQELPFTELLSLGLSAPGVLNKVLTDFHNLFEIEIEVSGGNANFGFGLSIHDNALATKIENIDNVEIDVDLNHQVQTNGLYDSVRLGDGFREVKVREAIGQVTDGSLDIFDIGYSKDSRIKRRLLCSPDVSRVFTFTEIDGCRRVTKIEFTAASLDINTGGTVKLTRTLSYQAADPFDLISAVDVLTGA